MTTIPFGGNDGPRVLTIVTAGHPEPKAIEALQQVFESLELIETNLDPLRSFASEGGSVNRAIDAAQHDWILLLRQHEKISSDLAKEISESMGIAPRAWGYRIPSATFYRGKPLRLEAAPELELRLLHRRHARFKGASEFVQGTVVRTGAGFEKQSFATAEEHGAFLATSGVPHSTLRAVLIFTRNAIATGALLRPNDLRYLWIEAKYDR